MGYGRSGGGVLGVCGGVLMRRGSVDVVGGIAAFANPPRGSNWFGGVLFYPRALFVKVCPRPTPSALKPPSSGGHRLGAGRAGVGRAGVSFYVTGE